MTTMYVSILMRSAYHPAISPWFFLFLQVPRFISFKTPTTSGWSATVCAQSEVRRRRTLQDQSWQVLLIWPQNKAARSV